MSAHDPPRVTHPPRVTADDWALLYRMRRDLERIRVRTAAQRARLVRLGLLKAAGE